MLMPKKVKHRKQQRGHRRGPAKGGTNVNFGDAGLQKEVEGPYHDPAHPTDPKAIVFGGKYGEAEGAERMAGIVGIRNVMAAFFLGRVDLIGGPAGLVP